MPLGPVGLARGVVKAVWEEKSPNCNKNSLFGTAISKGIAFTYCTDQSASSIPAGVRPFSEVDKRVTIEVWKAKVTPKTIRAQLQMSESALRMIIAYAKHHPENSIPKKSKNGG
jgi:hypothetical protein